MEFRQIAKVAAKLRGAAANLRRKGREERYAQREGS